jgi:hypothetical protein
VPRDAQCRDRSTGQQTQGLKNTSEKLNLSAAVADSRPPASEHLRSDPRFTKLVTMNCRSEANDCSTGGYVVMSSGRFWAAIGQALPDDH